MQFSLLLRFVQTLWLIGAIFSKQLLIEHILVIVIFIKGENKLVLRSKNKSQLPILTRSLSLIYFVTF